MTVFHAYIKLIFSKFNAFHDVELVMQINYTYDNAMQKKIVQNSKHQFIFFQTYHHHGNGNDGMQPALFWRRVHTSIFNNT